MGNDSGIRRKHKQRTVVHKKHTAYPGITLTPDVKIEAGSIRVINKRESEYAPALKPLPSSYDPKYDESAAKLRDMNANGSSAPLAARRTFETNYTLAYRELARQGRVMRLRGKYRSIN